MRLGLLATIAWIVQLTQPVVTILDDTAGGAIARRLLPAAFILPIVLGWLRLTGERRGWFSSEFGLTLFVLALIVLFNLLIWWIAPVTSRPSGDSTRL